MDGGAMRRAVRGFTLIEVMIAITIMGVLALICWRALDSVANSDQRLRQADAETTTALRVLQQFQRDIEMRADDALMNGAVRPADQPQRLLPPSLVSERHPDGSFALEITRSVGSDGLRWQRVRWWRQGSTLWRASGAATDRYPLPAPDLSKGIAVAREVQRFEVRAWQPGTGWAVLPSEGEVMPATGLELRLGLRDGRGPLSYRRGLELLDSSQARHPRTAWIYGGCRPCLGGCRPLVGIVVGSGIRALHGSPRLPPGTLLHPAALCRWSSPLMAAPCPPCRPGWGRHRSVAAGPMLSVLPARSHPRKAWIYLGADRWSARLQEAYRRCVPSSRLACGNWKALLAS